MKILVVDDEKTIVKGIKFNLENEGYQVDVCYDGETAVDMARHGEYAVILLDLMMPKLDGLGACQRSGSFPPCDHHAHRPQRGCRQAHRL